MDNTSIAPQPRIADWLAAVAYHLAAHPHLEASASTLNTDRRTIQIYPHDFDTHLHTLVAWADTLTSVGQVIVTSNKGPDNLHLRVPCRIGAVPVYLVVLPDATEAMRLGTNTDLAVGAKFSIDLVRALVGSPRPPRVRVIRHGDIYDGIVLQRTDKRIVLGDYAAWYPGEGEYVADPGDRLSLPLSDGTQVFEGDGHADVAHELALAGTRVTS